MPPSPFQRKVYCAFSHDLEAAFSVVCHVNHDTFEDIKYTIKQRKKLDSIDVDQWILYRPGRVLSKNEPFCPSDKDFRLPSKLTIKSTDPESSDPEIDIVILAKCPVSNPASSTGISYRPPNLGTLVNSPGREWDFQASDELTTILHQEVQRHFSNYIHGHIDKSTIPLYLFLSGAGTGKSRNAAEIHNTMYHCFDGTYFDKHHELEAQLRDPFIFHVSFENGTSVRLSENDPWRAIGTRMLLQILQVDDSLHKRKLTVDDVLPMPNPQTPNEIIELVCAVPSTSQRTIFLVVDGLHNISKIFGEIQMLQVLTQLGDLAHSGFVIVCGTSTISGPFDRLLASSRRRRVPLPCSPLDPPKRDNQPVFDTSDIVREVLVSDCGGHGRPLELFIDVFELLPADVSSDMKYVVAKKLHLLYSGLLPNESDSIAIVKAVLGNRRLSRHNPISGTEITPDEICQNGLIRFVSDYPGASNSVGHLSIPYVWLLTLCLTYEGSKFFDELQLLDYRDFRSKQNPTLPGAFNWGDFEKLMIKIRKIKSHVFHDGEAVTLGDIHKGAIMTRQTGGIAITNRHLQDDVSKNRITTRTTSSNSNKWLVATECAGQVDIRSHNYVIQNGQSASAGDAVLSLDTAIPRNECHQYNNVQTGRLRFVDEKSKAAGADDIFVLFCTSSVPSLRHQNAYHVPDNTILVTRENWNAYFGPYAGRSYLLAKQAGPPSKPNSSAPDSSEKRKK